mmetsp:Transcript_15673/g.32199  ORF Transcript_15673/g.32199 Transcript_15673/m.32199 type:complete len:153 (+) Transcript_15673:274-732(+)|eukprot:CAMPEP_0201135748 /NCGR_PEP_ID=MMETSP0850-20130426/54489_1 /ASSEMBLY_ACC=CAM_ASM_000622 /TAXON_ID=183588 /ORGANISM="Pseudo-nitzschia fraudulenta, Strain WWA7" /LENGTH=152 /DNA_ID=CAMNT_0047406951 /DNA_START=184 /DNA_END=642 /DNA_ORIENTATION=-
MSRTRSASIVILLNTSSGTSTGTTTLPTNEDYPGYEDVSIIEDDETATTECKRDDSSSDSSSSSSRRESDLDELAHRALEAADRSDKVLLRHSTSSTSSSREGQESLVKMLVEGGASHENITVVRLDQNEKMAQRSSYRTSYCTWRPSSVLA